MSESNDQATVRLTEDDRVVSEGAARPITGGPGAAIRRTMFKLPGSREQVPALEADQAELNSVSATTVLMDRSGAELITAERVTMDHSGARTIDAKSAQLDHSGVVALGSEHTVLLNSSAVQVVAEEARISRSKAFWISTQTATIESSKMVVFSGSATGDVRTVFTARTAAIFGGAAGVTVIAIGALLRSVGRRG